MEKNIIAYVTNNDDSLDVLTFNLENVSHWKDLLVLLYGIGGGMKPFKKITFTKV